MSNEDIRVLIVDDTDSIKKIIRPTLVNQLGFSRHNIYETPDGRKALEMLNTTQLDLVVCEWDIPGISGIDLLKSIRKHETLSKLPFILLTAKSDQRSILEAAQAKVSQYVIKPFSADSFSQKLNLVLQSKERRASERHHVTKSNKLIVMSKGKTYSSGTITNISKGGLLAKLLVQRAMTIYDILDLKISLSDTSSDEIFVNSIRSKLIRIEQAPECTDQKTGYYAFMFNELDQKQRSFLEKITLWMEQKTPKIEKQ